MLRDVDDRLEGAPAVLRRALARGGVYADVFVEASVQHRVRLRARLGRRWQTSADRQTLAGEAVQVHGARRALATTDDHASLQDAADAAARDAGNTGRAAAAPPPLALAVDDAAPPDAPDAVTDAEVAALLTAAADAAFGLDAAVRHVDVHYVGHTRRALVAASDGPAALQRRDLTALRVEVLLAGGDAAVGHAVVGGPGGLGRFLAETPEDAARAAVALARQRRDARPLPAGTRPVVLAAGWGGVWLHEAVGHLLEADTLADAFAADPGTRVAPPGVTLVDDGTRAGARGTAAADDEGVPARRTVLVEDGRLRGVLADRWHARRRGTAPTGNGRRQDYRHAPSPRMTNLVLAPGDAGEADLLAGIADGLYVDAVGRGAVQPDGTFWFEVLAGRRIEGGRLTRPVAGVRLYGHGPASLRQVEAVGRRLVLDDGRGLCVKAGQTVPVSVGMPAVRLAALRMEPAQNGFQVGK